MGRKLANDTINALFKNGILINLRIGRWGAFKKMQPEDLKMEGKLKESALYIGHKKLMPKETLHPFISAEADARKFLSKNSIPFPINGAYFVTNHSLEKVIKGLNDRKAQWDNITKSFVEKYEESRKKQLAILDEQARILEGADDDWVVEQRQKNESLYPPQDSLWSKFYFRWAVFKLTAVEEVTGLEEKIAQETKEMLQSELDKWVVSSTIAIHKELGEACAHVVEMLDKNGKVTTKNIKPLLSAFDTFSSVDFVGSSVKSSVDKILSTYGDDPKEAAKAINESKEAFSKLMSSLVSLAADVKAKDISLASLRNNPEFRRVVAV